MGQTDLERARRIDSLAWRPYCIFPLNGLEKNNRPLKNVCQSVSRARRNFKLFFHKESALVSLESDKSFWFRKKIRQSSTIQSM